MCSLLGAFASQHLSSDQSLHLAEMESRAPNEAGRAALATREQIEQQYENLWNEYGQSLCRLAAAYESSLDAREDLLQDIRLAIWRALRNFRGECSLRTFVYRIAHNRALTHVWRRGSQPRPAENAPDVIDSKSDPESSAIRSVDRAKLLTLIRGLPILYRQVITMALEDLPQSEIAAVLGISENNVAVRLNRARKLLGQRLRRSP